ncbi:MAG: hypothetical protein P8J86_12885 [Phycisphaerales bacterium]|nr:hypothetical protein [Phycisphaerales bacterium]
MTVFSISMGFPKECWSMPIGRLQLVHLVHMKCGEIPLSNVLWDTDVFSLDDRLQGA